MFFYQGKKMEDFFSYLIFIFINYSRIIEEKNQ